MISRVYLSLVAASLMAVSACVSPEVVVRTSLEDDDLTCPEIKAQLVRLDAIRVEAKKGKTASGENVAAALLFWPAIFANVSNANQAIEAANARQDVLVSQSKQKRC